MLRRKKIIATLGPATDDKSSIESLIRAGIDLVRINFSHRTLADHQRRVTTVRKYAAALGRAVGILGDLQGPKIRISRFQNGCITLEPGRKFVLDAGPDKFEGSQVPVGVDYKQLSEDVNEGDCLLLDDGRIEMQVDRVDEAISMSVMYAANHLDIKAIVALTESGLTPVWMSRIRTAIPIFDLSLHSALWAK
jgi:pyruvate kinase